MPGVAGWAADYIGRPRISSTISAPVGDWPGSGWAEKGVRCMSKMKTCKTCKYWTGASDKPCENWNVSYTLWQDIQSENPGIMIGIFTPDRAIKSYRMRLKHFLTGNHFFCKYWRDGA